MTVGVTVTSFSASLEHKTSVARDCLCQIMKNENSYVLCMANCVKP